MKGKNAFSPRIGSALLTVLLVNSSSVQGIERPSSLDQEDEKIPMAERVPPDGQVETPVAAAEIVPEKKSPAALNQDKAWLGIGGEPVHQSIAWHLEIDGGIQLRHILPDSPAEQLGLKPGDIVTNFNGTQIFTQNDLSAQIELCKPGDEVPLAWFHRGKFNTKKVTLIPRSDAHKSIPEASAWNKARKGTPPQQLPTPQLGGSRFDDALRQQIEEMRAMRQRAFGRGSSGLDLQLDDILGQMSSKDSFNFGLQSSSSGSMTLSDGQGTITVNTDNGLKNLRIQDREGNLLFEGPYNSPEDKEAVPTDLRERIKRLGLDSQ